MYKALSLCAVLMLYQSTALAFTPRQQHVCLLKSMVYEIASATRNSNGSPAMALDSVRGTLKQGVSLKWLKFAINQVFFDPRFVNAGGRALQMQMYQMCLYPNGLYKPLQ